MDVLRPKPETWWTRPCGGFDVLRQAIPLIISSGSISLMNFTDRMFLMWESADAMTASMQGGMLFWSAVAIPMAIAAFTTTFVAQYHGSRQYERIGIAVWQGIWFGIVMMPVLLLLYKPLTQLFLIFGHDEKIFQLEQTYYYYMLLSSAATISGEAAASFFRGRGKMRIDMFNTFFCVFVNIVLDYCLIFGKFGFPHWGLEGAAIATTIAQWLRFSIYIFLMFIDDWKTQRFHIVRGMVIDVPLFSRLLYFGTPAGIYTFIDTAAFTLFIMIIGGLGDVQRTATTIAFTLNSFIFMPLSGIGIVVTSMVGNQLGKNRPDLARRATITSFLIGCCYTGFFVFAFLVLPEIFITLFSVFTDPKEFAAAHDLSIILLRFIAFYLFFDSCSIIFCSTLRGAGDTVFVMWLVIICAPLYPLVCWIGIHFFGLDVLWCWTVLTAAVFLYCVLFVLRYRSPVWESMRVIEKE
jgi:MATE family multidrug resistance protein